ncbi:MAG: hypothetical protein ACPGSB_07705, partial [Opitutales bacterium]
MSHSHQHNSDVTPGERFIDLREGENYWKQASSEKGAFMVDGASYFRSFREALKQAESYVCILAWDL